MVLTKWDLTPTEIALVGAFKIGKSIWPKSPSDKVRWDHHDPAMRILNLERWAFRNYYPDLALRRKVPDTLFNNLWEKKPWKTLNKPTTWKNIGMKVRAGITSNLDPRTPLPSYRIPQTTAEYCKRILGIEDPIIIDMISGNFPPPLGDDKNFIPPLHDRRRSDFLKIRNK